MEYSKKTLETIRTLEHNKENENIVFKLVEELESEEQHVEAANVISVYLNFVAPRTHEILIEKNRECVKMLIRHGLASIRQCDNVDNVYLSRITKLGIQSVPKYTIYTRF